MPRKEGMTYARCARISNRARIENMKIIYVILAAAFLLRMASLAFGLPIEVFGDELSNVIIAFKVLAAKSPVIPPEAEAFLPPLFSYILAPIFGLLGVLGIAFDVFANLSDFKEFVILNRELFLMPARIVSALFGTATIYFLYLLAEKIFNKKIAVLSAFLLAINFLHIHDSQIGHIWSPIVFFMVAGAYSCYNLYLTGGRKWYFFSGLAAGLGYAIGQVPAMLYLLLVAAHWFYAKKSGEKFWNKKFAESTAAAFILIAVFTLLNPYTFYKHGLEAVGVVLKAFGIKFGVSYAVSSVVSRTSLAGSLRMAYQTLLSTGPILLIFGILGALVFFREKRGFNFWLIVLFPLFYLGVIASLTNLTYRYVLPLIPFLALLAAHFVFWIYEKSLLERAKKPILVFSVILVCAYSLVVSSVYSFKLTRPYTVSQGVEWIYNNLPEESRIVSAIYLNASKESVKFGERYNKFNWVDTRKKHLLTLSDQEIPRPNYFLINPNITDVYTLPEEEKRADYFVITFYSRERESQQLKILDGFDGEKELIAKFYPQEEKREVKNLLNFEPQLIIKTVFETKYIGPNVEIYRTIK